MSDKDLSKEEVHSMNDVLKKFLSGALWWINAINNLVLAELH